MQMVLIVESVSLSHLLFISVRQKILLDIS